MSYLLSPADHLGFNAGLELNRRHHHLGFLAFSPSQLSTFFMTTISIIVFFFTMDWYNRKVVPQEAFLSMIEQALYQGRMNFARATEVDFS